MTYDKLVKLIKETAKSHFHSRYKHTLKQRGRYKPDVKLAEEDAETDKEPVSKKPNKIEVNPTINTLQSTR